MEKRLVIYYTLILLGVTGALLAGLESIPTMINILAGTYIIIFLRAEILKVLSLLRL